MLIESLVGVVALIAATSLPPGDYFAINIDLGRRTGCPSSRDGIPVQNLHHEAAVRSSSRRSGAVSRRGMAQIFRDSMFRRSPPSGTT
jgi:carbon starvation protein